MSAKRIWLATLLVVSMLFLPAVSRAETFSVTRTDALIALIRQVTAQQFQIQPHEVLIIWNDQNLEQKLAQFGQGISAEVADTDIRGLLQRDTLMVKVMQGTRYKGRVPVRIKVDGFVEVYSAARQIARNETLKPDSIKSERVKLSSLPPQAIRPPFRIEDFIARQDIPANTVLKPMLLTERLLVEKGNPIRVLVVNQGLKLLAQGEALDSGVRNAMVRVRITNFNSNKVVRARVSDEGEVTLEIQD